MARRQNPYEAAFEAYLRQEQVPYVAIDEARRSLSEGGSIKNLDFIVSPTAGPNLLVDIKGRRFPTARRRQYWKNWATAEDLLALARWQQLFGPEFSAALVFAYHVVGPRLPAGELFCHAGRSFAFLAVDHQRYTAACRRISPRWQTFALNATTFRRLAVPVGQLLRPTAPSQLSHSRVRETTWNMS